MREHMEDVLLGESGMGETTLLRKFERTSAVPFDGVADVEGWPVVVTRMPYQPSEAAFIEGLPVARHAPAGEIRRLQRPWRTRDTAFRLLREIRTRVLVIVEVNSILVGTPRQRRLFLQLPRFLSNELSFGWCLILSFRPTFDLPLPCTAISMFRGGGEGEALRLPSAPYIKV